MHIGMVIWGLCTTRGGLQRVGALIANAMQKRGHKVTVFCNSNKSNNYITCYDLNEGIGIEIFDSNFSVDFLTKKKELLLGLDLDVLCALFSWDALLLFPKLMHRTGIPFIISEHNNPRIINTERWNHYERLACLASADLIHLLTNDYREQLPNFLKKKAIVIPNPAPSRFATTNLAKRTQKRIFAMGRFIDSHKNFSTLISSFGTLSNSFPDWELVIAGEGKDLHLYENLIAKLRVGSRIHLIGQIDNVDDYYTTCDIFCIPSKYEGFPMVGLEALSHGLPIVGFASCSGLSEVVQHGHNGFLAEFPTQESLSKWLSLLMQDNDLRSKMSHHSLMKRDAFDSEIIFNNWENLFFRAAKSKNKTTIDELISEDQERQFCQLALSEILLRDDPFSKFFSTELSEIRERVKKLERTVNSFSHPKVNFSLIQRIILAIYSPILFLGSKDKSYYYNFRHNPQGFFSTTKHPVNKFVHKILTRFERT